MKIINAGSVQEAVTELARATNARLVAGGTDVLVSMNGHAAPEDLTMVSICGIAELGGIVETEEAIEIGALVTDAKIIESELLKEKAYAIWYAAHESAGPQVRNRATVGGNIGTASPAADVVCALEALDAEATIVSSSGERKAKVADIIVGVKKTGLAKDEMITKLTVKKGWNSGFVKQGKRSAVAISVVNAAAAVKMNGDIIEDIRVVIGSAAITHVRAAELEEALKGKAYQADEIKKIAKEVSYPVSPITDTRAPGWYREKLIPVLAGRAVTEACEGGVC